MTTDAVIFFKKRRAEWTTRRSSPMEGIPRLLPPRALKPPHCVQKARRRRGPGTPNIITRREDILMSEPSVKPQQAQTGFQKKHEKKKSRNYFWGEPKAQTDFQN